MAENKFIGGWTISNFGGVGVIELTDEYAVVQYYDNNPEFCEVLFDEEGDAYIKLGELELYFNECMRY